MASPTVRRRQLSAILREMRKASGLSLDAVAARLEWSRAKVGHIETGQRKKPSVLEVKALMAEYGVTPEDPRYETVLMLTRQAQARGWWRRYDDLFPGSYIELEAEASEIRTYEAFVVPGLLQTPGYTRLLQQARLDRDPDDVERAAESRRKRQEIFDRTSPPAVYAIIEEHALERLRGTPDVLAEQVAHLLHMAGRNSVTLQVLRTRVGVHAGAMGPFVILDFPEPASPVVYLETYTDGLFLERREEIDQYRSLWDRIRDAALPPDRTVEFLRSLLTL